MKLGSVAPGLAAAGLLALSALAGISAAVAGPAAAQPAASAASSAAPAAPAASGAAMPGAQVFQDVCGNCHDLAVSTDQPRSRTDWQATVSRMVGNGAPLSDQQVAQVVDYLSKNYGPK